MGEMVSNPEAKERIFQKGRVGAEDFVTTIIRWFSVIYKIRRTGVSR